MPHDRRAQAREKEIVLRTLSVLRSAGAKVYKTSGQGEPDLIGSYKGFSFAIECKQTGKRPTPLQQARLREWRRSGAIAFATDWPAQAMADLHKEVERKVRAIRHEVRKEIKAEMTEIWSKHWPKGNIRADDV